MRLPFDAIVGEVVRESIGRGETVGLDGLGTFHPDDAGSVLFTAETEPRVFVAYASEDCEAAGRLHDGLSALGFRVWMDKRRLLPGQNWRRAIDRAIESSDFFIPCFSLVSVRKRGQFPHEVRRALQCAGRMPLDDAFILPVRLEECCVPARIRSCTQYVDMFPDWEEGVRTLAAGMWSEYAARLQR